MKRIRPNSRVLYRPLIESVTSLKNQQVMDLSFPDLNFNSVVIDTVAMLSSIETLLGFEACAAFTVNSATVFREARTIRYLSTCSRSSRKTCRGLPSRYGDLTQEPSEIVWQIKALVVGYLRSGSFNSSRLADIVNYIWLNAESFEEWHKSETAKLFAPPVFRNEKKASGYFF